MRDGRGFAALSRCFVTAGKSVLLKAETLDHEALEARFPQQVVGELFAGEHGECGLAAIRNHA